MGTTPSSLLHYTSSSVLEILLNGAYDDLLVNREPMLKFHASIGYAMNDSIEGKLFFDYFFTGSNISNEIKHKIEDIIQNHGEMFIISMSHSHDRQANGEIPMWNMYGDGSKGVMLRFNYKKLKEYCNEHDYILEDLKYKTKSDISNISSELRKKVKIEQDTSSLCNILRSAYLMKEEKWKYEDEYRILIQQKPEKYKDGKYGLVAYSEVNIPISCLESITIGPLAHQDIVERSLLGLVEKIKAKYPSFDCKIKRSKIQIR